MSSNIKTGNIKTMSDQIDAYTQDSSALMGGHCKGVYTPTTVTDLKTWVKKCHGAREPITISGAGTGTVGGRVPFGGWVLSMERLSDIGDVKAQGDGSALLRVQAGARVQDIQVAAGAQGYFYPPNPTETSSFIGGNIATNASGSRSFKYGSTRAGVASLDMVLCDGRAVCLTRDQPQVTDVFELQAGEGVITGRLPSYSVPDIKFAMGYFIQHPMDMLDLFIGAEGTLGIVTAATLRLLKAPDHFLGGIFFFRSFEDMYAVVSRFQQMRAQKAQTYPCSVEFYDQHSLVWMRESLSSPAQEACAALYLEQEVWKDDTEVIDAWATILECPGCIPDATVIADDTQKQRKLIALRHSLPAHLSDYFARHQIQKISTDFAIPEEKFLSFYKDIETLLESSGIRYVAFGHIGDCNIHINLLPTSQAQQEKAHALYADIMTKTVSSGGVICAEHGVGKIKRKWMPIQYTEIQLSEIQALKTIFDPTGVLNPGVLLP